MSLLSLFGSDNIRASVVTREATLRKLIVLFPLGIVAAGGPARLKASAAVREATLHRIALLFPLTPPAPSFSSLSLPYGNAAAASSSSSSLTLHLPTEAPLSSTPEPACSSSSSSLSLPEEPLSSSSSSSLSLPEDPASSSSSLSAPPAINVKGGMWKTDKQALAAAFVPHLQCVGVADTNRATNGARRREKGKIDASVTYVQEWHKSPEVVRKELCGWQVLFEEEAWTKIVLPAVKTHSPLALRDESDGCHAELIPEQLTPTTLAIIEDAVISSAMTGEGIRRDAREELKKLMTEGVPPETWPSDMREELKKRMQAAPVLEEWRPTYIQKVRAAKKHKAGVKSLPRNAPVAEKIKHVKAEIAALNKLIHSTRKPKSLLAKVTSAVRPQPSPMAHKPTAASRKENMLYRQEEERYKQMIHKRTFVSLEEQDAVARMNDIVAEVKRAKKQSAEAAREAQ